MTATTRPETDALVKARVLELLESWHPWHRRLWDLGTVLAMREVIEEPTGSGRQQPGTDQAHGPLAGCEPALPGKRPVHCRRVRAHAGTRDRPVHHTGPHQPVSPRELPPPLPSAEHRAPRRIDPVDRPGRDRPYCRPLVGAALDRLAHGHTVSGIAPLDLASRAELALRVVGDDDGWQLHELLGA